MARAQEEIFRSLLEEWGNMFAEANPDAAKFVPRYKEMWEAAYRFSAPAPQERCLVCGAFSALCEH